MGKYGNVRMVDAQRVPLPLGESTMFSGWMPQGAHLGAVSNSKGAPNPALPAHEEEVRKGKEE